MIYIIGAGGVGSWLTPSLAMLIGADKVAVVDADKLESKNLNRQLFDNTAIGQFKADALAQRYGCESIPKWFTFGMTALNEQDVLMGAVDNHATRAEILQSCDNSGCMAIIGANEVYSSEAYVYIPEWKDTQLDPRHYYPEILLDKSDDPRRASMGCTGEAQTQTPQLVTANFMAAALMQHLFITWVLDYHKFDKAAREHLPHKLVSNLSKLSSIKTGVPAPIEKDNNHAR